MTHQGFGRIFSSNADLRTEFDGGFWLEGPSQGPDGRIYFSDITPAIETQFGDRVRYSMAG